MAASEGCDGDDRSSDGTDGSHSDVCGVNALQLEWCS
eukprot:CAMPEP_0197673788 /NCGR_PEP_ID=MMETSP1338-20131121/81660_1 /TAXON_ID=43686 ORGANISM="Pelagodinium beii, Strain RCC1491" /NCGR_SAMPLE_ID=MMETSP1338 /ASSEMBLY_ACC=CAM_ASM_000754 /LENGTH=36 /DNA_ID= /DNA_START= /DNA_END= /DNA_ORIENTATION=